MWNNNTYLSYQTNALGNKDMFYLYKILIFIRWHKYNVYLESFIFY